MVESQLPFGWVCFSNVHRRCTRRCNRCQSQLPFGWVCFSNSDKEHQVQNIQHRLNCLSAGSVSLTRASNARKSVSCGCLKCLSAGSVSLTRHEKTSVEDSGGLNCLSAGSVSLTITKATSDDDVTGRSQLPFGWVCFSNTRPTKKRLAGCYLSQLPFGWVCFSNPTIEADAAIGSVRLNCLSAGSVSLTSAGGEGR